MQLTSHDGESHILRITLRDETGSVISPSLPTLTNLETRLINRVSGEVVGKWSRSAQAGFMAIEVVDNRCVLYCPKSILLKKHEGDYDIQVTFILPCDDMVGGKVFIQKAPLLTLKPASNG